MFPLEFHGEVKRQEIRVIGLLCGEGCMILSSTVFDWSIRVTDRRTDGRAIAYSALKNSTQSCPLVGLAGPLRTDTQTHTLNENISAIQCVRLAEITSKNIPVSIVFMCLHFCVHLFCAASCVINDDDDDRHTAYKPGRGGEGLQSGKAIVFWQSLGQKPTAKND